MGIRELKETGGLAEDQSRRATYGWRPSWLALGLCLLKIEAGRSVWKCLHTSLS